MLGLANITCCKTISQLLKKNTRGTPNVVPYVIYTIVFPTVTFDNLNFLCLEAKTFHNLNKEKSSKNIIKYICAFHESIRNRTQIYVCISSKTSLVISVLEFHFVCLFSLCILNIDYKVQLI